MCTEFVWDNKKVIEMDNGGSCTTLSMYLMPLRCSPKTVNMLIFLCVFHHNKKRSYNISVF